MNQLEELKETIGEMFKPVSKKYDKVILVELSATDVAVLAVDGVLFINTSYIGRE